jgi:predicted AlkP superfamily pyrophosphatase or phosphodiesterase
MLRIIVIVLCIVCGSATAVEPVKPERHVVVVVWDGMRPDFVSEQNTPALWKLSHEGVTFRNHHAVYPSATIVNGTALVTGDYPSKNGIIANHVYRPDINPDHAIDVETPAVVKKGDELSGGKYISVPTIAELVQRAGGRTIIATAKTVGLLLDRHPDVANRLNSVNRVASPLAEGERMEVRGSTTPATENAKTLTLPSPLRRERRTNSESETKIDSQGAKNSVTLFAGKSLPLEILTSITETLGPFPPSHLQQDLWTTKALIDFLWKDGVPAFSILWLGEPDLTQHESAPGAPAALAAIKSADENLAAVLAALDQRNARGTTDVFVVSDHGFSTIRRSIDLRKILNDAGFAAKTEFESEPKPGEIMLAGNGGSVLFYVVGHDEKLIHRLVEFLQQSDFVGVIFTKEPMEGTFMLEQAKIHPPSRGYGAASSDHAPDVMMSFRWNDSKNQFGIPGTIDADWQRAAGKGTHATLSRFDMHNTLIAAGPDFRRGETDDLPTGNIDLAPTILQILGSKALAKMDGRVLSEAMIGSDAGAASRKGGLQLARRRLAEGGSAEPVLSPKPETKTIEAKKDFPSGTWRQSLQISRVGPIIYLDEGNGVFTPK